MGGLQEEIFENQDVLWIVWAEKREVTNMS